MEAIVYTPSSLKKANNRGKLMINVRAKGSIHLSTALSELMAVKPGDKVAIVKLLDPEDNSIRYFIQANKEGFSCRKLNDTHGLVFNTTEIAKMIMEAAGAQKYTGSISLAVYDQYNTEALGYQIDFYKILKQL